MDDTPLITGSRNQPTSKQGSKILGCCCDSKRSTIIWNLLNIIYAAVSYYCDMLVCYSYAYHLCFLHIDCSPLLPTIDIKIIMAIWIVEVKVPGAEDKTTSPEAAEHFNKGFVTIVSLVLFLYIYHTYVSYFWTILHTLTFLLLYPYRSSSPQLQ